MIPIPTKWWLPCLLIAAAACSLGTSPSSQQLEWNAGRVAVAVGGAEYEVDSLFGSNNVDVDNFSALQADWEYGPAGSDTTIVAGLRYQQWDARQGDLQAISAGLMLRRYLNPVADRGWNPYLSGGGDLGLLDGDGAGSGGLARLRGEAGLRTWLSRRAFLDVAVEAAFDLSVGSLANLYGPEYGLLFGVGMRF